MGMYTIYSVVTHNPVAYFYTLDGARNYMRLVGEDKVYMIGKGVEE